MRLDSDTCAQLGVGMNEADLIGVSFDVDRRVVAITLSVLALPVQGEMPDNRRVSLELYSVGRVAVSVRNGAWDDDSAEVVSVELSEIYDVVASFDQAPIYGWEFVNVPPEKSIEKWSSRLSLDWQTVGDDGRSNTLELFQEGNDRHVDLIVWFDSMRICTPDGAEISVEEIAAGGQRWWEALNAGDPRVRGVGTAPPGDHEIVVVRPDDEGRSA